MTSAETTTQGTGAGRRIRFGTVTFAEDLAGYRRWIEVAERTLDDLEAWWMLKAHLAPSEEEAWPDLRWTLAGTGVPVT